MADILQPVCTWTFKGILCTCRFLWICPYNAVQFLPREKRMVRDTKQQKSNRGESKAPAAIPGSPDRTSDLQKRLTKTETEILSLKSRVACERAAWERRFTELQRKQEELHSQLVSEGLVKQRVGSTEPGVDNGDVFEECTSDVSELTHGGGSEEPSRAETYLSSHYSCAASALSSRLPSSSSSVTSVKSWRSSVGPHRVFVPHSPQDLKLGHRVRIMLPSGRISTGTLRYMGNLQGAEELHLGVELHTPDHGLRDGSYRGHCYFHCKPGYGAFVPFHKLLMAWE